MELDYVSDIPVDTREISTGKPMNQPPGQVWGAILTNAKWFLLGLCSKLNDPICGMSKCDSLLGTFTFQTASLWCQEMRQE